MFITLVDSGNIVIEQPMSTVITDIAVDVVIEET